MVRPEVFTQKHGLMNWHELVAEHSHVFDAVVASVNSPKPEIPREAITAVVLQRSRHLVEAFALLIAQRNLTACGAIIRMQLDSLMRLYACSLVADPMELWEVLNSGVRWGTVRSATGEPLSDKYLHEQLSLKYAWASGLYARMSGYVHLSTPHLDATIQGEQFLGMVLSIGAAGSCVTDDEVKENDGMMQLVT
ncbi:MAG: hypothetical protein V3T83_14220, partial [Acidobacteriota bacterium]